MPTNRTAVPMALGRCRLQAIPCQEARTPDTLSSWHTGGRARHLSSCAAGVVTHGTPPSSLWLAHGTPPSALWLADDTPPRGVPTSSLTRTHAPSTLWLAHDTRRLLRRLLLLGGRVVLHHTEVTLGVEAEAASLRLVALERRQDRRPGVGVRAQGGLGFGGALRLGLGKPRRRLDHHVVRAVRVRVRVRAGANLAVGSIIMLSERSISHSQGSLPGFG